MASVAIGRTFPRGERAIRGADQMDRNVVEELEALRKANELREERSTKTRRGVVVALLLTLIALMLLWSTGRMDPFLSNVGLNKNDCIQNAFGATFCGDEAKAYEENVQSVLGISQADADPIAVKADVRAAVPSIEAFYSDHGAYTGATAEILRNEYDSGISTSVTVRRAAAESYCLEATRGAATASYAWPGGTVLPGPC
jgi:hypothetical protein